MKYIVGTEVQGYSNLEVEGNSLGDFNINVVVVVKSMDTELSSYYNFIRNVIISGGNVILIGVGSDNETFKALASLMTSYKSYNIYSVDSMELINNKYISELESRKPDFSEVQTYIGGDVTSYSEMSALMLGIQSLVEQGDTDGVNKFVEQHLSSIKHLTSTIDYMKTKCELDNSDELVAQLNKLKKAAEKSEVNTEDLKNKANEANANLERAKLENAKLQAQLKESNSTIERLKVASSANNTGAIIKGFKTLNLSSVACKAKHILYFKEISYVRYFNSFITALTALYEQQFKVKLVIYDTQTSLYKVYQSIRVVDGRTYTESRSQIVKTVPKFVVTEPTQNIITDIVTYDDPAFDIVIIIDRMKTINDVVEGNNVTKFWLLNSENEYKYLQSDLKIFQESRIITRGDELSLKDAIKIQEMKEFRNYTNSNKILKYNGLINPGSNRRIVDLINEAANIEIAQRY